MAAVQTCPKDETLRSLMLGSYAGPDADALTEHLLACAACGARAGQLTGTDPLVADLRAAHNTNSTSADATLANEILRRMQPKTEVNEELAFLGPPRPEYPTDMGTLGRYRVLELLGQGGMGMVFKAVDTNLERTLALKVILPKYASNEKLRVRFLEEGRATVRVRSAHVAEVYDCDVIDGVPFLTMEMLVGMTLDKRPMPMPVESWRRIAFGIAKGLADAHRVNVIHRDLKPSNIHLGTDARTGKPTVKLIDFGLARPVNREVEVTKAGELLGTPAYMSPEQARGKKVDHRTDLYSLGVILHQMATGKLPYVNVAEGVMAILTELAVPDSLPSVTTHIPTLPPDLVALIDRLLEKDPAKRPASADEVMKILKESAAARPTGGTEIVASAPFVALPETPQSVAFGDLPTNPLSEVPVAKPRRKPWLVPALGLGVVAIGLLIALGLGAFKVKTKDGTIVLNDLAEDAEVLVDGETVKVTWDAGKQKAEVRIPPGTHTIEVRKDGFRMSGDGEVTLEAGDRKVLTAKLEKEEIAAKPAEAEPVAVAAPQGVVELVENGKADDGNLKGWTTIKGTWTTALSPPPGDPYFRPRRCAEAILQQDVDVSRYAKEIDAGGFEFKLSALLMCYSKGQKDKAQLKAISLDAEKKEISTLHDSGPVHEGDGWRRHGSTKAVPVGTRFVRISLRSIRDNTPGNYECSGYFDNISLTAMPQAAVAQLPTHRPGDPPQYLGVGFPKNSNFVTGPEAYGNILIMGVNADSGDYIESARRAKRNVVLAFQGKARETIEASLYPLVEKNRDTVAGVLWSLPYANGYEPPAVESFGRELKQRFPGLSYLVSFGDKPNGKHETRPVPAAVDVVLVSSYSDTTPEAVRTKADDCLPVWIAKANGRPVVFMWNAWSNSPTGIVPQTRPGTMRAVYDAAVKHKIAGVAYVHVYSGTSEGIRSIESNPVLLKEVEDVGRDLAAAQPQITNAQAATAVRRLLADPMGMPAQFFCVGFKSSANHVGRFAASSNLLFASGLPDATPYITAARAAGRPLVLAFSGKSRDEIEAKLFTVIEKNRDVVAGICWSLPYGNGYQPADVAALGVIIKNRFPGLVYCLACADRPKDPTTPSTIPAEVDLFLVNMYSDNTPDRVRTKADLVLPGWIAQANGRPIILRWAAWEVDMGLVPRTEKGTFRACVEAAKKYKLAGVAFEPIDDDARGFKGIASNPDLVAELEELGRDMALGGSKAVFTNTLGMKFARVPKGSVPIGGRDGKPGNRTATVTEDFFLGTYEVTQEQWQKVMGTNPASIMRSATGQDLSAEAQKTFAVNAVSWHEAREFAKKLTEQMKEPGWEYRLPTEHEWEYACRGGPGQPNDAYGYKYYAGDPSNVLDRSKANFADQLKNPCPVGKYSPNKLGLYDMHGNVAEWCNDVATPPEKDASGNEARICRGGGHWESADYCDVNWRSRWTPNGHHRHIGLRVARVPVAGGGGQWLGGAPVPPAPWLGIDPGFTNTLGMKFARVPKGKAWLGGGAGQPPAREVEVPADFYFGIHEITQAEWLGLMGSNPSYFSRGGKGADKLQQLADADLGRLPVEGFLMSDVSSFLAKLNERAADTGWVYRLPTGDEWEYACRGGPIAKDEAGFDYYGDKPTNALDVKVANFAKFNGRTQPVGAYPPNRLGLHDMHGNVWELTSDTTPKQGRTTPVWRGGCWDNDAPHVAAAWTHAVVPFKDNYAFGLRVVRAPVAVPAGFTTLFNGKDLTGWSVDGGDGKQWAVENGEIVGTSADYKTRCYILTDKDYSDYTLRFEFKLGTDASHGGVATRAMPGGIVPLNGKMVFDHPLMKLTGSERPAQDGTGANHWIKDGTPFSQPLRKPDMTAGKWYAVEVVVRGDTFKASLDGQPLVDVKHDPKAEVIGGFVPGLKRTKGKVGFQINTGRVSYRNVMIQDHTIVPAAAPAPKFQSLFNGKDRAGWFVESGEDNAWRVKDGELIAKGVAKDVPKWWIYTGYLLSERKYSDFILKCQYRTADNNALRSGIAFRAVPGDSAHKFGKVWQADDDTPFHLTVLLGGNETGELWWSANNPKQLPAKKSPELKPAGEWNDFQMEVQGQQLRVTINGQVVQDMVLDQDRPNLVLSPALTRQSGRIGFMKRNGDVNFRNIEIQELAPSTAATPAITQSEPVVVSRWNFHVWGFKDRVIKLYSNGRIDDPNSPSSWTQYNKKLVFRWANPTSQDPKAPGGYWVDTSTVSDDGQRFNGKNQLGRPVSGQKLPN